MANSLQRIMNTSATIRLRFLQVGGLSVLLFACGCSSPAPEASLRSKDSEDAVASEPDPGTKSRRKPIYDETANARADIQAAIRRAAAGHKRVLVKFGGNWCGWCFKLHDMFHDDPVIAPILEANYELVLVDSRSNRDLMERLDPDYEQYGYPWLAVLDSDGKLLTTQETGVLEKGDKHDVDKVRAFLLKWQARISSR